MSSEHTCCFIGHRRMDSTENLIAKINKLIEHLIVYNGVTTFIFGSRSEFNDLCLSAVTQFKDRFPNIARVYIRAEYPIITDEYEAFLLQSYESTYYPREIKGAGRAVYVERNRHMIDVSNYCVFYYNHAAKPTGGTALAYNYAVRKQKNILII